MVQSAIDAFGTIDIVINNAGILRDRSFAKMSQSEMDFVLDVHLRGSFYVTSHAWNVLRDKGYGRVINTASNSGLIGNFGQANYGAAKMGIVGLTRVLAIEGARSGINVNAIAPTAATRMTEGLIDEALAAEFDPARVASAVAWLVHPDCEVTGEIISAGGGRVARYFVGLTPGFYDADLTPESVREHWSQVVAPEGFIVPLSPLEEIELFESLKASR